VNHAKAFGKEVIADCDLDRRPMVLCKPCSGIFQMFRREIGCRRVDEVATFPDSADLIEDGLIVETGGDL
jgi:hypothetical protein